MTFQKTGSLTLKMPPPGGLLIDPIAPLTMSQTFEIGQVYFGTLCVAHGDFPVRCTRRTDKSVWFEHVDAPQHYPAGRAKLHRFEDGTEAAMWRRWYVSSTKTTGGDFDPLTI